MSEQTTETADPEAERVETLDARFGRIEHEQAEQRGLLEQIRDAIAGEGGAAPIHEKAEAHTQARLDSSTTIAEQVRKAVEAVGAEQAQREADEAHKRDHEALRAEREKPPRESGSGFRGKLQRAMYGGDQ
jgi:hypothetical protein